MRGMKTVLLMIGMLLGTTLAAPLVYAQSNEEREIPLSLGKKITTELRAVIEEYKEEIKQAITEYRLKIKQLLEEKLSVIAETHDEIKQARAEILEEIRTLRGKFKAGEIGPEEYRAELRLLVAKLRLLNKFTMNIGVKIKELRPKAESLAARALIERLSAENSEFGQAVAAEARAIAREAIEMRPVQVRPRTVSPSNVTIQIGR